ncbi:hypothetical protein V6Z11_A12G001100 [Gossypium hirsutum]
MHFRFFACLDWTSCRTYSEGDIPFQGYPGLGISYIRIPRLGFMNNLDFNLSSPDISPAIKRQHFIPSSFVGFWVRSTPG